MATYKVTAPDGHTYTINGPEGASDRDIAAVVAQKYPYSAYTSKQLEDIESAPTKVGDVMRNLGSSAIEGPKTLTNLFGATNPVSEYLSEKQKSLLEGLSPERQQEQRIDQELIERAKGTGILNEIGANLNPVARRPIESSVSGLLTSLPFMLAPEGALATKGLGSLIGKKEILGSLMGIGSQKEQNYQDVLNKAIEEGKSPEEAKRLAEAAGEYSLQNAPGLLLSAGTGALEGKLGAASKLGTALRGPVKEVGALQNIVKPSLGRTLGKSALESGGEEFLQGSGAQVASNIALSQAGFDTPLFEGATGAGAHDALIGALTGAAVSPMQLSTLKREYDQQQSQKLEEEGKKKQAEQIQKEEEFKKNFGVQLALPAPAKEIQEKPTDLLQNPLGNFTADELGEERVKAIDAHREAAGKPRLNTYSIEDVVDAMPKENPEAERAALNELVANKANSTMGGYSNQKVSAQDVLNAATLKGVDTNTQGFKDFLTRATGLPSIGVEEKAATSEIKGKPLGLSELDMMTDAQRFVAQQSLLQLPSKEGETTILPKGTNATHYDQGQYLSALGAVDELHKDGKPATKEEALAEIKKASGLNRDQDAEYLLRDAIRRGDFDLNEKGEIVPAETASYLPEGHAIEEVTVGEGEAPENYTVKAGDRELKGSESKTEAEAQAKLERYQEIRANRSQEIEDEIAKKEEEVVKSREKLDNMEALGQGRSLEYQKAQAAHAELEAKTSKEIGDLNRDKALLDPELHPLAVKTGAVKPVKRKAFKLHKAKAGEAATQVGSYPTRQAAEQAITSNMSESELEDLAKDTRRRTLARRARQELNDRRTEKIKVRREFKQVSGDIAKEFESFLAKIGLKGVGLKLMSTLGGSEGEYTQSLIKVALDVKNPLGVLRHESIHALKDLGFFSDNQWNALRRMAKDKWIKQFMKDVPYSEGVSRYDAYKSRFEENPPAGVTFQEYIEEEAIADAFRYFHENGTPPGMIAAILKRLNQFFEALRNALNNGGFYTSDDIFEKIEKGELVSTKQGTAETKASLKNTTKGLLNPSIPAKQEKILNDVVNEMGLTPEEFASTSLIHQTGKPGTEQFESDKIGGLSEVVQFLQDQRRQSGLPLLNVDKPEDRKIIAKLMATEAMAAIRSGGANLEWYDSIINKTLAMAGLKYPELNTDINARMAFRIATAITSQGLNVEDNLGFAMKVYDGFRKNGKFPEIGQGADQSAMVNNFKLANYLLDDMGPNLLRQFLETEFTVEEMRSAGFDIKGELGDENVLGSSVFGPKIGFGFYSNLNGNFDPVTMDMWFMRTIGRLTGNLKSFRQDLYNAQLQKFRDEFDVEGDNGVFANQFDQAELDLAKIDDKAAEALARKVKSAHERDYKINRAGYDDKTRIKSPLVGASETMIKSLDAPRDAPSNGTERRNLRDVVRQMVDIVEEKYGKRVPPASLQAVIWYPEQELYKAMGVKLRVTSQNYAGAIEKILIGEGYDAGKLSAAAKLGSRTAQQLAKSAVAKRTQATGTQPVRLGALQAEEKENLLERGRKRVILEQEKETPKRKRVVFEVAPDPNNKALTDKWRSLPTEKRIEISNRIGNKIVKDALDKFVLTGYVDTQIGSYGDDTNPSFALYLNSGDSVSVANFLGYALSQDSMMVISPKEGKGLDKTGAVRVNIGNATADQINDIYQQLREIEVDGEKPIGGQSFMNGHMVILNYSNVETSELAKLINEKLQDKYNVITEDVYSAFPEKKDYDYANPSSDPRGNAGVLRQASRDLRSQATQLLQKELRSTRYSLGSPKLALRPSDRSDEGITLGQKQPDAVSFTGTHYGKEKTDVLNGDKYGTGIRGAERKRLEDHWDDRVKRRVYFYIPKVTGEMPAIESGLGGHVYTQKFNNILGPGKEISRIMSEVRGDANEFESAVVDAGYDGYAVPNMGMMVILNHDVPANYEGTASEVSRASLKAPETPAFKRFFGDSKITDKNGEPMVMYHATNSDFNVFNRSDDGKLGEGIYSTSIPKYANEFAPQGNVMPLFVHAENPFVINVTRGEKAITERFSGDINKAMVKAVADFTDGKTRLMDLEGNQVRELFEKNGYDGIVVKDDQGNIVEANVFTPTQLKSAIGNTGAYSVSNPNIRYSLDQLTKGMSNPAAFQQRLNTVVSRREDVGHARRMIDALNPKKWGSFRREFLNRYDELAKVDKKLAKARGVIKLMADASAEAAALLSDMASSLAAQALGVEGKGGVPVFRNGYTSVDKTKKGAVEIFAPLAKYGPEIYSLYQFWAGAKRGRRLFREGREENYTAEDFKFAKELEQKYGTLFNSVQKDWLEYNNALVKYQVDTGVLSPARAAEYTKYSDYIPFYRQLDGEETVGPKLFQSMSGVKQSKVLKGGEVAIADFLETIVRNTQAAIQAGTKNVAAQLAVKNSMELGITEKTPVKAETFNTIRVFENGKETFYHTHDKLLLESMQGLNLPQLPFLGFFAAPANFLRNMVTKDPGFILANMMRDSVQAYVTSGADIVPFVDTVKHFGSAVAGKDPIIEKLKAAGLGGGHDFASDIERSGRDLAKKIRREAGAETKAERLFKPATSIWEFMERSTEASDLATRAAIYEKTLAETGNEAEAIYQALEVMNFYRKGANPLIRIASAVIPFLNARIQGLDVFYRSGIAPSFKSTNPTEADQMRQKVFFTRAAYVMALSCAYWALVHDDDDYKKQEQETKDNNWLIPELGIKIPTPFEVGFLFKVLPERAMQYFFGDDTGKDFGQAIKRGITSTFQLQFPQIIQPAVEASTNFSFFTGRAIVPPGLENVAPEFQVGPSTSKTFEVLGQSLGQSPIMLEHLWRGYTGTIGMYLVDVVDSVANMQSDSPKAAKRFEQMPFIKRFALDPEARGQVSSYYDLKNSVDEAVRTENLLEKTGNYEAMGEYITDNANLLATHDYILEMDKKMKELQQNAALIRNSGMDAESKKDILTAIGQAQNALTANVQYLKKLIRSQ